MNVFTRKNHINYTPAKYLASEDESNSSSSDYETTSESSEGDRRTSHKLPLKNTPVLKSIDATTSFINPANGYKGTQYDFSITSKMRGMWFKIILDSVGADEGDNMEKIVYLRQFRRLQQHFPCAMCKKHFGEYILMYPPEQVMNLKEGFFNYIVEFMNSINRRIGKEEYDRNILYGMVHTSTTSILCTKDCGIESSMSKTLSFKTSRMKNRKSR